MRRIFSALLLLSVLLALSASDALACGDKFLLASRGARGLHGAAAHPGSILIYMNPGSSMASADRQLRLQSTLTLAGHKTTTVDAAAKLEQALKSSKYDIVLADVADAAAVKQDIDTASPKTRVVPVVTPTASKAELKSAQTQYGSAIKASASTSEVVGAIDDAMASKLKSKE